jgi:CBS domain-containing protein
MKTMSERTMKELMDTDVLVVHQADSMETVAPQLSARPERFIVILDDEDVPTHLTTASDLQGKMPRSLEWPRVGTLLSGLPKAYLVGEAVTLERAMGFYHLLTGSPGLVVVREGRVAGVLPYEALANYFKTVIVSELVAQGIDLERIVGKPQTVPSAVFRCRRYPRCTFETTADMAGEPPLCGKNAIHGRTQLVG